MKIILFSKTAVGWVFKFFLSVQIWEVSKYFLCLSNKWFYAFQYYFHSNYQLFNITTLVTRKKYLWEYGSSKFIWEKYSGLFPVKIIIYTLDSWAVLTINVGDRKLGEYLIKFYFQRYLLLNISTFRLLGQILHHYIIKITMTCIIVCFTFEMI